MRILALSLLVVSFTVEAAVLTVSNQSTTPAQFTTVQAAVDAAQNGDTILIHGSGQAYSSATFAKQLVIVGQGHSPQAQGVVTTTCSGLSLQPGASGTVISGLKINTIQADSDVHDVIVERCLVLNQMSFGQSNTLGNTNWIIRHNIIQGPILIGNSTQIVLTGLLIHNNVFGGSQGGLQTSGFALTTPGITVWNNVFLMNIATNASQIDGLIFSNNIVLGGTNLLVNSVCTNNISFQCEPYCTFNYGSNSGGNNLENVEPIFNGFSATQNNLNNVATEDLRLTPASPGYNGGSDGTDIGVFGGSNPFLWGTNYFGSPKLPLVQQLNVQNGIVAEGGDLEINAVGVSGQ